MLVATPGQAATYSLLGSSAPKKTCLTSSATPKSTTNNSTATTSICGVNKSSSSAASTLMKTISVRLNRGTEFLKDTVQKALINNTTTSSSSINFHNTNINNINTTIVGSLKHIHGTSAVAVPVSSSNNLASKSGNSAALASTALTSAGAIVRTSIATNTSKSLKLNTVPPTKIHRYPQERQEASRTDSINKEMCHFKPILSAPTMRWKCGSKSRGGASIKIPIACLATNIKSLNCDDCAMVADSSSEDEEVVDEERAVKGNTTHPHKYHKLQPKPSSTLLTTIITSASHQSAFVRLVAQMKTMANIHQSPSEQSHSRTPTKKPDQYKKRPTTRSGRQSKAAVALKLPQVRTSPTNFPLTQVFLRSRKQSLMQVKDLHFSNELIVKKGEKVPADAAFKSSNKETKNAKGNATKKTNRNATKSKMINIVAFAQEKVAAKKKSRDLTANKKDDTTSTVGAPNSEVKINQRKRKRLEATRSVHVGCGPNLNDETSTDLIELAALPPLRKSARLSKDGGNNDLLKIDPMKQVTLRKLKARRMSKRLSESFSPPMTRSRLKELMQKQSVACVGSRNKKQVV
ncbi:uncharacterized protein LOC129252969 [Anastrepha obliqua]|uniref:uncharacterized protein LOC129252969 n=1 Tax=Anastrepha obliqua TaxID=95512 RepID=UPI00240925CA|nr:uncharacterized protein LOC129252969 [Anastrepha obliqua]XP_054747148.1 uncharacterized protein LOC129252969 [Anastrepha obliqua]